jgi:4'-phosphopantetheinyl transferase
MKAFFAPAAPYELASGWTDGLWEEKRQRIARMRREADKALALTAHRLLCYALRSVFGATPQPQDFALEPQGKPYLKSLPGVHFSLSHSDGMAMCALHDGPVGADIERLRAVGDGVAERVMSAAERRLYMNAVDRQSLFFQIWTLKEAYAKFSGAGLGVSFASFTVCPSGGSVITDTGCAFWMTEPAPGYQAAVCAQSGAVPDAVVTVDARQLAQL